MRLFRFLGLAVTGIALLTATLPAGRTAARPETLVRDEIPDAYKWNLADIYPGWEAWEEALARIETIMDEYIALKGTLAGGPKSLLRAFKLSDELGMVADKVGTYAGLSGATDMRDNEVSARRQQVGILFSRFGTAMAWFNPEMLAIPWETMEKWLDATPELAPYRFRVEDLFRQQSHVLTEDKEELLSYFRRLQGNPSAVFGQISAADIQFPDITLSSGDTLKLTSGAYYNVLSTNRNQEDRADAFDAYYGLYNADINTYAAIYDGVLQADWAVAQARNYDSCMQAELDGNNIPLSVYENLVAMVREGAEPVHRYHALRQAALGLEEYHGYDTSIPIVEFDNTYPYDEVQDLIIESVKPLGDDYVALMREAFSGGWLDVYENEGKTGGAFSAGCYGVHPYMLLNYNDTITSFFTLAHEMGHTLHTMLAHANQPFSTADYTIFVAEVASTLNEALLLDYMLERSDDPVERVALLLHTIDDIIGTFYTQVMFADFEMQTHRLVEDGQPITADVLKEIYTELWHDQMGPAMTFDDYYGGTWTRIDHFYGVPYYVYQYATCYASSSQIHQGIVSEDRAEREAAVERYLGLLESGGNDYPMEQLKRAGVDLTDPAAFQAVIDHVGELVTRLEQEMAKL